jgi:hypothetical protein
MEAISTQLKAHHGSLIAFFFHSKGKNRVFIFGANVMRMPAFIADQCLHFSIVYPKSSKFVVYDFQIFTVNKHRHNKNE